MDYTPYNTPPEPMNPVAVAVFIIFAIAIYIYSAYCLYIIAQKTNTPNAWFAWVPILNLVLMLQIIRKSLWWILGMLIPIVNLFVIIWVWAKIAEARNRPWWWGILMIINPINLVILWFMTFRDGPRKLVTEG